ncbi:MAG: prephenate dehydrogenase [Rickettsiaceae bacterium]|jgi:prephenate dehydrogenase|nr:prephenate dehydrogenase [Rickettsiaceae bacterium]
MVNNQSDFLFDNINIIGLGLIGGSLAKSCKNKQLSRIVRGYDSNKSAIDFALQDEIIDEIYDLKSQISDGDLTIIAAPLSGYKTIFKEISGKIGKGIVIDIGSLKFCVSKWAEEFLGNEAANFIACHPIAGSEKSGIANSDGNLFLNKKAIICPDKINHQNQIEKIELFWQKIGSDTHLITAQDHDKIFALMSHLPQFLAFIAKEKNNKNDLDKHFRLQNSNHQIWQEIFSLNQKNIKYYLKLYIRNLEKEIEKLQQNWFIGKITNPDVFIIKRMMLVLCLLNLPDVKKFEQYAGSGFKDFYSVKNYDNISITETDMKNLIEFLEQLKLKIISYEFE